MFRLFLVAHTSQVPPPIEVVDVAVAQEEAKGQEPYDVPDWNPDLGD